MSDNRTPVPQWSDIAGKDEFQALTPEQKEQTRSAYFDRVIKPRAPADQLDSIRAEFDKRTIPAPVEPEREEGFWSGVGNSLRGAGERVGDLAGGFVDAIGAAAEASPTGIVGGNPTRPSIRPQKILSESERKEVGDIHHGIAENLKATDFGYDQGRYTLDRAKSRLSSGDYLGALTEGWAAGMDTLAVSTPDMVAAASGAGIAPYIMARSGEIADERAKNKGLERATAVELREAAPFAAASAVLERILPKRLTASGGEISEEAAKEASDKAIRHVMKRAASEGVKDFGIEGGTEFVQEGILEYLGENYGTDVELSARDAFARGAEAAILGGIGGGTVGAAKGAVDGIQEARGRRTVTAEDVEAELEDDFDIEQEISDLEAAADEAAGQETQERPWWEQEQGAELSIDEGAQPIAPGKTEIEGYNHMANAAPGEAVFWQSPDGQREAEFVRVAGSMGGQDIAEVEVDGRRELVPMGDLARVPNYTPEPEQAAQPEPTEAPEGTINFERPDIPERPSLELEPQQAEYNNGVEFSPQDLPQNTAKRDQMAAGVQRLIDQHIDQSRYEKLPEGLKDPRLLREEHRTRLEQMAGELVKGGDVGYVRDEHDRITGRTPSVNPEWFKAMTDDSGKKLVTTEQLKTAVDKALRGEKLGERQAAAVQIMLDEIQHDRQGLIEQRLQERADAIQSRDAKRIAESLIDPDLALPESGPATAAVSEVVADILSRGYSRDKLQSLIQQYSADGKNPLPQLMGKLRAEGVFSEQSDGREVRRGSDNARGGSPDRTAQTSSGAQPGDAAPDIPGFDGEPTAEQRAESERELSQLFGEPKPSQEPELANDAGSVASAPQETPVDQENLLESYTEQDIAEREAQAENLPEQEQRVQVDREREEFGLDGGSATVAGSNDPLQKPQGGDMFASTRGESSPESFVSAPDGSTDFGEVDESVAKAVGRQAGKIRLQEGVHKTKHQGYGRAHIAAEHPEIKDITGFVRGVASDFDAIYKGRRGRLQMVKGGSPDELLVVELRPMESGDFYSVVSAYKSRKVTGEKLWDAAQSRPSGPGDQNALSESVPLSGSGESRPSAKQSATGKSIGQKTDNGQSALPKILTDSRKKTLIKMAKEQGIKRSSPGYNAAMERLGEEYDQAVDRAQAELTFEQFNALNSDSPESVNRQAYDALREEYGIDETALADIDAAASQADTNPTEAQKEAGNYQKGHINVQGLDISVENPKGSERSGTDPDGNDWSVTMNSHYGYIRRTEGADGEHVDVFVGPEPESQRVYVVDQVNPDGSFDEHKVLVGYRGKLAATKAYKDNYTKGWKVGPVTSMSMDEFKAWLKDGDNTKPLNADHFLEAKNSDGSDLKITWSKRSPKSWKSSDGQIIADHSTTFGGVRQKMYMVFASESDFGAGNNYATAENLKEAKNKARPRPSKGGEKQEAPAPTEGKTRWVKSGKKQWKSEDGRIIQDESYTLKGKRVKRYRVYGSESDLAKGVKYAEGNTLVEAKENAAKYLPRLEDYLASQKEPSTERKKQSAPAAPIEDFGEKLGGARKDEMKPLRERLENMDDDQIAQSTLGKLFPKAEIDKIENKETAAWYKVIRDIVPAKPRKAYKLQRWVESVKQARDMANLLEEVGHEKVAEKIKESGKRSLSELLERVELLKGVDRKHWMRIDTVQSVYGRYMVDGELTPGYWIDVFIDGRKEAFRGHKTVESAIPDVATFLEDKEPAERKVKFAIYSNRNTGEAYIVKEGDRERRQLKTFENVSEARKYQLENYEELVGAWEAVKNRDNVTRRDMRRSVNAERTGVDYRKGEDVTPQQFLETFGFRGVEFGNWVKQGKGAKERQSLLNDAYDAFLDLAEVLNLPPKAMSLEGRLGIGMGSRGQGGAAAAHYEPDSKVINLTKTKGAGSLAHEWFHALDNYFSNKRGEAVFTGDQDAYRKDSYVTYKPEPLMVRKADVGKGYGLTMTKAQLERRRAASPDNDLFAAENWVPDPNHKDGVRPVVEKSFASLVKTLEESPMSGRAIDVDKGKVDAYWSRIIERAARSFENYVIVRLADQGYQNDFLANVASEEDFVRNLNRYPYLKDNEVTPVAEAFDNLFESIETKETGDGNVALFKSGGSNSQPVEKLEAQSTVDRIASSLPDSTAKIELVDSFDEFPEAIKKSAKKLGFDGSRVKGAYRDGTVYLNRSALKSAEDVERTIFHELYGHHGLKTIFGQDVRQAMGRLYLRVGGLKGVRDLARKHNIDLSRYERGLSKAVNLGIFDRDTANSILAEELLAHISENQKPSVIRALKEFIGAIRSWLRKNGFIALSKITDSDIMQLLKQSRQAGGHSGISGPTGTIFDLAGEYEGAQAAPAFSVSSMPRPTRKIIGDDPVLAGWTMLAQNDDAFQLPVSDKKGIEEIFNELEGPGGVQIVEAEELALQNDYGAEKSWRIITPQGKRAAIYQKGDSVWIDVSAVEKGQNGKRIYNAVANYAHNNDLVFVGDPDGLSDVAQTRRLENMISSALKFGTTKHLWPHQNQVTGNSNVDMPNIEWKDGKDAHNLRQMIDASYQSVVNQFPEIQNLRYNPKTDQFEDSKTGEVWDAEKFDDTAAEIRGLQDTGRARGPLTAGRTTLERAVLTNTFSRGTRQEVADILEKYGKFGSKRLTGPDNAVLYSIDSEPRPSAGVSRSGEGETLFSVNDDTPLFAAPQEAKIYGIPKDYLLRKITDKMRPLLQTQREIEKAQGGPLDEALDAYRAEEAFHGKTENDIRKLREQYVEPLAEKMADYGVTQEELDMYLWARHAPERNAQIAKINPDMPDGGSGMTDQQARQVLKKAKDTGRLPQLVELAKTVYALQKRKQELLAKNLVDGDQLNAWNENYKHYVPLKGRATDESNTSFPRVGKGFDIRGKESLRALGRRTKPESPLLHTIMDTTEAIIRSRKNEVGLTFLDLVEQYPNPDYWEVFTAESPELEPRLYKNSQGETVGEGPVIDRSKYFSVKRDGKEHFIKINDERLMKAMKNMGPEPMNKLTQWAGNLSRFLSSVNTSFNPEFVVTNAARDIQTAVVNVLAEQDLHNGRAKGKKIAAKMVKSAPKAGYAIRMSLAGKQLKGEAGEWQKAFDQFREDGAKTGWFDSKDIEGQKRDLQKLLSLSEKNAKGNVLRAAKAVGEFVENTNAAVENAVRLSVYKHAIDAGVSRKKATELAKNLTVNFNRKGEIGQVMNALYMFFNASVQGTMTFARAIGTLKDIDGKKTLNAAQKVGLVAAASAFGLAALNREMAGEDDDGVNWYDKVPDWVKERNIVLMKSVVGGEPGEYWKIPLPYGYNIFHVFGTQMEGVANGTTGVGEGAVNVAKAAVGSFVPLSLATSDETGTMIGRTITPTVGKPFVDLWTNENFWGGPIYRENMDFAVPKADAALYKRSTPEIWKNMAMFMNKATGGGTHIGGWADVSPDSLDYLFDYFTGGAGAFVNRAQSAITKAAQGVPLEDREIPFKRQMSGKVAHWDDISNFYDRKEEAERLEAEWKTLKGKERVDFYKEHGKKIRLKALANDVAQQMAAQRKRRDRIEANEKLTAKQMDERLEKLQKRMKREADRFNRVWPKD
ncbi:LPD38 domain-containing protein [Gilvimarinus chinensis]|uniref:LPD38 domain-containing protein n=1 Tax=Gilvimarinus chinensis TaxID=396005 RepID=UPI0003683F4C|nr:LPD38 domain-containing protein [Gilvimarinus chinensis]